MDRAAVSTSAGPWWLPRACGDGPVQEQILFYLIEAPPRLRGWTAPGRGLLAHLRGSPAPAGMDRPPRASGRPPRRLPRACGDGPRVDKLARDRKPAPPRLRGWTLKSRAPTTPTTGSPAPAGMDLLCNARHGTPPRLPRACGDGPVRGVTPSSMQWAPPRLRGWTWSRGQVSRPRTGSPAPAGMDRR